MHPVRRLSVFCGDSETRAQADGNAHLFLRFHPVLFENVEEHYSFAS